jgi:urea transport system substrate-binding protein
MVNQSYNAPGAEVRIDPSSNHTWKVFRLGKIAPGNSIQIVYSSDKPIDPEPFPATRTRAQWEALIEHLYQTWGNEWVNPQRPNLLNKLPPIKPPR